MNTKRKLNVAGFTLVEILVVLAIVALLSAILFSVFVRVRERGRNAVCQSNLKQLAIAIHQYTQDNDGRYPPVIYLLTQEPLPVKPFQWNDAIMPYVKDKGIFKCPDKNIEIQNKNGYAYAVYGYNRRQLNETDSAQSRIKHNIFSGSHESKPVLSPDTVLNMDNFKEDDEVSTNISCNTFSVGDRHAGGNLHSGGANYSFIDGHVKWLSPAEQGEALCKSQRDSKNQ